MKVVKDLDRPRVWGVEGVNQLGSSVSYSPPRIGGVAAHQENAAKPPLKAQTGWSVKLNTVSSAALEARRTTLRSDRRSEEHPQQRRPHRARVRSVPVGSARPSGNPTST